jgi:hypothetical protein
MTNAVSLPNGAHLLEGVPVFVIGGRVYRPRPCRYCGANIALVPHPRTRRNQPRNADGSVHFATCPGYRQRKAPPGKQLKLWE